SSSSVKPRAYKRLLLGARPTPVLICSERIVTLQMFKIIGQSTGENGKEASPLSPADSLGGAYRLPKPPLGDQGEVAGRRPDGRDQSRQSPAAFNPPVALRAP